MCFFSVVLKVRVTYLGLLPLNIGGMITKARPKLLRIETQCRRRSTSSDSLPSRSSAKRRQGSQQHPSGLPLRLGLPHASVPKGRQRSAGTDGARRLGRRAAQARLPRRECGRCHGVLVSGPVSIYATSGGHASHRSGICIAPVHVSIVVDQWETSNDRSCAVGDATSLLFSCAPHNPKSRQSILPD